MKIKKPYLNNQSGTGLKRKWEDTTGVNCRVEVVQLATMVQWLESNGNVIKTASDIVKKAIATLYYTLPADERISDKVEAYQMLKVKGLIQEKDLVRVDKRLGNLLMMNPGLEVSMSKEEQKQKELADKIARESLAEAKSSVPDLFRKAGGEKSKMPSDLNVVGEEGDD